MRRLMFALVCCMAMLCVAEETIMLDGTWSFHPWAGYQPKPEKKVDGNVLSVRNVTGQYGFALQSSKKPEAKAGYSVLFEAKVRGKGRLGLHLHNLDAKGQWISVSEHSASEELKAEWQDVTLKVLVDNVGNKMTERVLIAINSQKGSELDITGAKVTVT